MLVFNLTQKDLIYRGRSIPPNGGSLNYPELDKGQVPARDRKLEKAHVLAFGILPFWWKLEVNVQSKTLSRKQVAERDEQRAERAEQQIKDGAPIAEVIGEAIAGKILDEMHSESLSRTLLPVRQLENGLKDKGYSNKNRKK